MTSLFRLHAPIQSMDNYSKANMPESEHTVVLTEAVPTVQISFVHDGYTARFHMHL